MPTILPPDEHLTAGLSAVQKHIDYHEGELAALRGLRRQYKDALGIVAGDRVHVEQTPAQAIATVIAAEFVGEQATVEATVDGVVTTFSNRIPQSVEPTFDELVATMSGRTQTV